jgi:hypothetical protein
MRSTRSSVVAIGNPALRQAWQHVFERVVAPLGVLLNSRAIVSATAQLGPGSVVPTGAVVNANASLHSGVLAVGSAAYSQLGINATMAGVRLGSGEVLGCGESRFAALALSPGASDPAEGLTPGSLITPAAKTRSSPPQVRLCWWCCRTSGMARS